MDLALIFTLFCGYDINNAEKMAELLKEKGYHASVISSIDYRSKGEEKIIDSKVVVSRLAYKFLEDINSFDEYKKIISEANEEFNVFYRKFLIDNNIEVSGEYTCRVEFYDVSFSQGTCDRYKD